MVTRKELLLECTRTISSVTVSADVTNLTYHKAAIEGMFNASHTAIESLEGSPLVVDGFYSCSSTNIKSLEGAPKWIGRHFFCYQTLHLTSLHNIHKTIKHLGGVLVLSDTVSSHILGLLKIDGLVSCEVRQGSGYSAKSPPAFEILNKHLQGDRNIHACQEELIEAGFKEFARL